MDRSGAVSDDQSVVVSDEFVESEKAWLLTELLQL